MKLPKKTVRRLSLPELPEPFKSYWTGEHINRPYQFFDVDGELYILDLSYGSDELLQHWTAIGCAGVACFMRDAGISQNRSAPYVHLDGTYLFEILQSEDYEISARHPETGQTLVVHSG